MRCGRLLEQRQPALALGMPSDHHTGKVLAYVFGRRKDEVFLQLKTLLDPFGLTRYYTDHWLRREASRRNVVRPWGIQVLRRESTA